MKVYIQGKSLLLLKHQNHNRAVEVRKIGMVKGSSNTNKAKGARRRISLKLPAATVIRKDITLRSVVVQGNAITVINPGTSRKIVQNHQKIRRS